MSQIILTLIDAYSNFEYFLSVSWSTALMFSRNLLYFAEKQTISNVFHSIGQEFKAGMLLRYTLRYTN